MSVGDTTVAIGPYSLEQNTVGNNIAIGFSAAQSNITGTRLVVIGHYGGMQLDNVTDSVLIGHEVSTEDGGGSNNVVIGSQTSTGGFSNCIVLGSGAVASADGQFILGSAGSPVLTQGASISVPPGSFDDGLKICLNGVNYIIPLISD